MMVRFTCPACGQSHTLDMPETTVHMTCSRTHKAMQLRVTKGGDVRATIVNGSGSLNESDQEDNE